MSQVHHSDVVGSLGVSTKCGFFSTLPGANLTTQDVQERRLGLVAGVAHAVW